MEFFDLVAEQMRSSLGVLATKTPKLMAGIVGIVVLSFVLRVVRHRVTRFLNKKLDDTLLVNFIDGVFHIANIVILVLLALYTLGMGKVATTFLGAAGLSAFVIGFALKDIGENFLAGVVMAFDRPFKKGDIIKTLDVEGTITEMSLRDTHIKTFDGKDVFVPNGQIIKNPLYNYTIDGFLRQNFTIGIEYGTDVEKARAIILDAVRTVPGVLKDAKPPKTFVSLLNSSTIDIECQYWLNTNDGRYSGSEIKTQAQVNSMNGLTDAGIKIPTQILEIGGSINLNQSSL